MKNKKLEIEAVTKPFDETIQKEYDMFTVTFIRSANEVISILSFEHELSAIEFFNKIKKES